MNGVAASCSSDMPTRPILRKHIGECFRRCTTLGKILNKPGDSSGESERDENEDDAEGKKEKSKDAYLQLL